MKENKFEFALHRLKQKGNADYWLKQNGISPEDLLALDIELLQAQQIATNLLKHHASLLCKAQSDKLNAFLHAMTTANSRKRIPRSTCFGVMNIGKAVNRKLFRQYKHIKAH